MLIVANWKAYVETRTKAKSLFAAAKRLSARPPLRFSVTRQIVLAPPAPYLGLLATKNTSKVRFAAQDISDTTGGARTGEITAALLKDLGVGYVILGHSERRAAGETDSVVASKVAHALAHDLIPILCVGESERDADAHYLHAVRAQIATVFEPLSTQERIKVIIAYEPIWAIGKSAAEAILPQDLTEMILYLRKVLSEYLPDGQGMTAKILYGGSVEPTNARALAAGSGIDGFLVGHASIDTQAFTALVKAVS